MQRVTKTSRNSASQHSVLGKLGAPRLARVFERDRLFAQLDAYASKPIVWLAGPPGSGKTTLAASYLHVRARPLLWLTLDRADSDAATFFHFVSRAVAAARPRQKVQLPSVTNEDLADLGGFARRYFRLLIGRIEPPWVLVLDNYQELATDALLHQAMRETVDELSASAQILAISRTLPPPAFARTMANQQLGLIDAQALRFTVNEAQSLLNLHGQRQDAEPLHAAVDGWAAGLMLMLAADAAAPAQSLSPGSNSLQLVFDYFAGEVLVQMSAADREALMRIAMLPSSTEAMAIAISASPSAARVLRELFARNLFVDRRGGSEPTYVFHALFRDFLLIRALDHYSTTHVNELRLLAARLLTEHGQIGAAMDHLVQAKAWPQAEQLLHQQAPFYVAQERTLPVLEWIGALPNSLRDRPMNQYWQAYCGMVADPTTAQRLFDAAYAGFVANNDQTGQLLAAAGAAESIVLQGTAQAALDDWITVFEVLAPRYFDIHDAATELRVLPGMLAAFVARQSQHRLTSILADRAELLLEQEPAATQRILFSAAANCFIDTGQHERLGRIIDKLEKMSSSAHIAPISALRWRNARIFWKTLVGRVHEALIDADEAERLSQLPGMERMRDATQLAAAQAAWVAGDTERATRHLALARTLINPARTYDNCVLEFLCGVVAVQQREPAIGVRHQMNSVRLARQAGSPGRERIAQFALCLATTEAGDFVNAQTALASAKSHPSYEVSPFHQWVIAIIEANLADRRNDRTGCLNALTEGLRLARAHGYSYAPGLFATGIMPRMCALALEHGIDVAFVIELIRQRQLLAPPFAPPNWPWSVRITTLGRFALTRDDAALPLTRKEQRKPLDLLRLLVAQGGTAVSAKQLAQWLWPDAEGDAAKNSFDNALHRLRKLLGEERAISHQDGALSIDTSLCWVDMSALETSLARLDSMLASADGQDYRELDALVAQAVALYQGPFLPGDESFPPILAARERLRVRFSRQLLAVAARHEQAARWTQAADLYLRILEQDVLAEQVYRRLIDCYLKQERRAEAFDAYRRCRDNLSIILGIKPSQQTEALVARLRFN